MPDSELKLKTRGGEELDAYLSRPEGDGPFPGILLITAIFGTDQEMIDIADGWADDGFVVLVPDVFWRVLPGPTADREVAFGRYEKFDPVQGMLDIEDYIDGLKGRAECNGKVGVIGYCFGGRYAHLSAARLGVDAAASYHGTKIEEHLDETPNVKCPVTFHFGDQDPATSMESVEKIIASYASHDNAEIVVHPGAEHNFAMPAKPGYQEAAHKASRAATLRVFSGM